MIPNRPSERKLRAAEKAIWGPKPSGAAAELDTVEHWINPNRDSARVGTVSERLRKFIHRDCSITRTKYGFFVHLPSMPMVDLDGNTLKDEKGKWKYRPAVEAIDKSVGNAFSNGVLKIIRERWLEMLKGG